jgi:hypothetical protein
VSSSRYALRLGIGLIVFRWLMLAALPYESLVAYGDLRHFHQLAQLASGEGGWPFVGHWIEFPPLFPFLSLGLNTLVGGAEHAYLYALAAILACMDGANLYLFVRLAARLERQAGHMRPMMYAAFLALPALGWWTFEPLGVLWLLLTLSLILDSRPGLAGLTAGLGLITKWLPGLGLLAAWPKLKGRQILIALLVAMAILVLTWGPLLAMGGGRAWDSLRAQSTKPAWETVWALLDGTPGTGAFGPAGLRVQPLSQAFPERSTSVVPSWLPLLVAAGIGSLLAFGRPRPAGRGGVGFVLAAFVLLLLASPGWSPQWLAYLAPLILLALPERMGWLYLAVLTAVAILEWPVLLSRGRFDLLWLTVILRTMVMVLLAVDAWRVARAAAPAVDEAGL